MPGHSDNPNYKNSRLPCYRILCNSLKALLRIHSQTRHHPYNLATAKSCNGCVWRDMSVASLRQSMLTYENMDHTTVPPNPVHSPIIVPCLGDSSYSYSEFDSYPHYRGWDLSRLLARRRLLSASRRRNSRVPPRLALFWFTVDRMRGNSHKRPLCRTSHPVIRHGQVTTRLLREHLSRRRTTGLGAMFRHEPAARLDAHWEDCEVPGMPIVLLSDDSSRTDCEISHSLTSPDRGRSPHARK